MMVFGDSSNLANGSVVCRIGTELNFPRQSCVFEVFYKTSTVSLRCQDQSHKAYYLP